MDAERALICKAVTSGQLQEFMGRGIEPSHFADSHNREIWNKLTGHTRKYRKAPSLDTIKRYFPNETFENVTDTVAEIYDVFMAGVKYREATKRVTQLAQALDDPAQIDKIEELFAEASRDLQKAVPSRAVSLFAKGMADRIQQYELDEIRGTNWGVKMGIPVFDEATYGIQPHEFVTIAGWQNTGKSTLMQWIFFNAYMQGKTPMIISLEMGEREIQRKFDAFALALSYKAFRSCGLTKGQRKKWAALAETARAAKNDIIVIDDVGRSCTVDTVYGLIDKYQPDICAIDYVTLMQVPSKHAANWEKVTYLTNNLKQVVKACSIPIVAIAQTNVDSADTGAQLSNIAYSKSIGMDSDIVIGLHQDDAMRSKNQMIVRLLKNRQGGKMEAPLYWNMADTQVRPWTQEDDVASLAFAEQKTEAKQ